MAVPESGRRSRKIGYGHECTTATLIWPRTLGKFALLVMWTITPLLDWWQTDRRNERLLRILKDSKLKSWTSKLSLTNRKLLKRQEKKLMMRLSCQRQRRKKRLSMRRKEIQNLKKTVSGEVDQIRKLGFPVFMYLTGLQRSTVSRMFISQLDRDYF